MPKAAEVHPPTAWAAVAPGVTRWSFVGTGEANLPFLHALCLRRILLLSPEPPAPELLLLAQQQKTTITHFHLAPEPEVITPGKAWSWTTLSDSPPSTRLPGPADEPDAPSAPGFESFASQPDHDPFLDDVPQTQLVDPLSIFWSQSNIVSSIITPVTIRKVLEALVDVRNHPVAVVDVYVPHPTLHRTHSTTH